jgi:hypothetical protein
MLSTAARHLVKNIHLIFFEFHNLSVGLDSGWSDRFGENDSSPIDGPRDEDGSNGFVVLFGNLFQLGVRMQRGVWC